MFESEKQSDVSCVNTMCGFQGDDRFEQLCGGETEFGGPSIESCECYLPEKLLESPKPTDKERVLCGHGCLINKNGRGVCSSCGKSFVLA